MNSGLSDFYERVDAAVQQLAGRHAGRINCRKSCSGCCVDGITVFGVEAQRIAENRSELLRTESPHGVGACAFLDADGACRIYEDRPYVCRTQGLPLRWIEEGRGNAEEFVELRDICPLNEAGEPVEDLDADECWTIGPFEHELGLLQATTGAPGRVSLRGLFTPK
jgi:Fe-S-cluster containining protein